jgi:beta-lactamase superfamily II metal-dependent hydrolase/pimeloyl-ACP methyl ester carboxylesterase
MNTATVGAGAVSGLLRRVVDEFTEVTVDVGAGAAKCEPGVALEHSPILLVIDGEGADARVQWVLPDVSRGATEATAASFTLPPAIGADRGVVGAVAQRVVKLLLPRVIDGVVAKGTELVVRRWETTHRADNHLRLFTPATNHISAVDAPVVSSADVAAGRTLLLIGDLFGSVRSSFDGLIGRPAAALAEVYGERIMGYEHFTLSKSPRDNAEDLMRALADIGVAHIDVLAHGRGGLVARELVERAPGLVDRLVTAGTPHTGTPLCDPSAVASLLNRMSDLVDMLPLGGVDDILSTVLAVASVLAQAGAKGLPGLTSLSPADERLVELAAKPLPASVDFIAAGSDFRGRVGRSLSESLGSTFAAAALGPNDGLVRVESAVARNLCLKTVEFSPDDHVGHADYVAQPEVIDALINGLDATSRGSTPSVRRRVGRVRDARAGDLQVTVAHAGLEYSRFPVMVGNFERSAMYSTQAIVDERLGFRLSARLDADMYPGALGESCFIRNDDGSAYPPGVYVVGLGTREKLDRDSLAYTVRQALVQRCIPLFDDPTLTSQIDVGISSLLLGSAFSTGLTVDDSVIGVLDGVIRANDALVRYRDRVSSVRTVRVVAVQFVERAADRAELAVRAARSAADVLGTPGLHDATAEVALDSLKGGGGMPRSPAIPATEQGGAQLSILTRPVAAGDQADDSELAIDISMIGSDARVDRRTHSIDLDLVAKLTAKLPKAEAGTTAASTLFNLLIPEEFEARMSFAQPIQLVLDENTANIAWELLSEPVAGNRRGELANTGGIVRRFSESGSSRLAPRRANANTALLIAAGRVPGQAALNGVFKEAAEVNAIMADAMGVEVHPLSDELVPIDGDTFAELLMAEHKFVHIASHGVFQDNGKVSSALLGSGVRLNASLVSKLRIVPDVVFLNCCQLAGVGTHRFAPGIARELMGIGVRAVVAAGWNVDDEAAVAFARSFWTALSDGDRLGLAVHEARRAAAIAGGGTTWAAYQCYGDSGYRLEKPTRRAHTALPRPISGADLLREIESLTVRAGDIRFHDPEKLIERIDDLRAELLSLRATVEKYGFSDDAKAQRGLGNGARELGMHGVAVQAYRRAIANSNDGRGQDLERLANMEARFAQRLAFDGTMPDEVTDASLRAETATDLFESALGNVDRALSLGATRERFGVQASVYKKIATFDIARRATFTELAFADYVAAASLDDGPYGTQNALQFATLVNDGDDRSKVLAIAAVEPLVSFTPSLVDERPITTDFWNLADRGDRLLTRLMQSAHAGEADVSAAARAYRAAFGNRSTVSERDSVFTHLRDLRELIAPDDVRRKRLDSLLELLADWDPWIGDHPAAPPTPIAFSPVATTAKPEMDHGEIASDGGDDGDDRGTTDLVIQMFPAGPGDSIVVQWGPGPQADRFTMLIDGGLAIDHERGLGAYLAARGASPFVDLLVVTHIDSDHVKGAIEAIADEKLRYGDVWFNGTAQLIADRSVMQGRKFDSMTLGANRNRFVGGKAIVVADGSLLPTTQLPHGAKVTFLSPTFATIDKLEVEWRKSLDASPNRGGGDSGFDDFVAGLDEATGGNGGNDGIGGNDRGAGAVKFGTDPSVPNGSSIAFLLEYGGKAMMFTGDAYAGVLANSIKALLDERGLRRLKLDAFKVSHHGSVNNISADLLDLIECKRFLVSTDGSRHGHPNTACLDLIHAKHPAAKIHLNHRNPAVETRAGTGQHLVYEQTTIAI